MKNILLVLLALLIAAPGLYAQEDVDVKISAEVRPRFESKNTDFKSSTGFESATYLRSRLGLNLSRNNVSIFIQAQDSRVYGSEPGTISNTGNVDLHQGYFLVNNLFDLPVDLKAGRTELIYGPQRLIGAVGWSNIGRSFDGMVATIRTKKVDFDVFATRINESYLPEDSLDHDFFGVYTNIKASEGYKIQPFILWDMMSPSEQLNRFTLGVYINGVINGIFHETEFAYQTGDITTGRKQNISAWMAAFNIGYKFKSDLKPTISVGIDYLSGDDNPADDDYKVFNTLYATNHKYYGNMDKFINIPTDTYMRGLMDIHARFSMYAAKPLLLSAAFHIFKSAEDFPITTQNSPEPKNETSFGSELDLKAKYIYNDNFQFEGGFYLFTPGEIFETLKGSDTSTKLYLMGTVSL